MAILIKTGRILRDHSVGTVCTFKERAYRDPVFGREEKAFIWVDGAGRGGKDSRLYAEGMVVEEPNFEDHQKPDSPVRVKVVLTRIEPVRPLRYSEDILPHRNHRDDKMMHSLADIICKHSHKKVTMLSREQSGFLAARFD